VTAEQRAESDWTAPGAFQVADGVHRIPLPLPSDGLRAVNLYALIHAGGLVLIDPGWAVTQARAALDTALAALGHTARDVDLILATHIHRDHYTQAIHLRREFGIPVSLGAGEREAIELSVRPDRAPLHSQLQLLRQHGAGPLADRLARAHGRRDPWRDGWEAPDDWLADGQVVQHGGRALTVLATPGHTRGHVVFHDAGGHLLFAGDHILPRITPSIGFEPVLSDDPLGAFLGSLTLIRSRPDARLLPAHGPVGPSAHARVDELIAHHGARLEETEKAISEGAETAAEAAGLLRWTRRARKLGDLDPYNQMLAVLETRAHLDLLAAQGRLQRQDCEGLRYYLSR
jgi:glyoxylase-like metal-dependent hydrolase (beta-lactamase superfamily II)